MAEPVYFAVLTDAGSRLEARALESGKGIVLSHIAVGDANRKEVTPESSVSKLVHEVCRRPIDARSIDDNDPNVTLLHATIPADVGGFWIYELGVYGHLEGESELSLYAYANHAPYYKMLPQAGQLVTHELLIPIVQKTDATLIIELPDTGYVTRGDYLNPKRACWNLASDVAAGGTVNFPSGVSWLVGKARLELYWLGLRLAKDKDYQEVGASGASSSSVKLLFAASAGDEFQAEIFK